MRMLRITIGLQSILFAKDSFNFSPISYSALISTLYCFRIVEHFNDTLNIF